MQDGRQPITAQEAYTAQRNTAQPRGRRKANADDMTAELEQLRAKVQALEGRKAKTAGQQ